MQCKESQGLLGVGCGREKGGAGRAINHTDAAVSRGRGKRGCVYALAEKL